MTQIVVIAPVVAVAHVTVEERTMPSQINQLQSRMVMKGKPISVIGGKYKGLIGWVNVDKKPTKTRLPVVLQLHDGEQKATAINKENVKRRKIPANRAEAIMKQQPDINKMVEKLAMALCDCCNLGVVEGNSRMTLRSGDLLSFNTILLQKIHEATDIRKELGDDANIRVVDVSKVKMG